jgi:hypothetical protein
MATGLFLFARRSARLPADRPTPSGNVPCIHACAALSSRC